MSLGLVISLIVASGYASVWLTGRYLNYRPMRALYYIGAVIHESSHALLCLIVGARIREISFFSAQPHVTHDRSRLPLIGPALISLAPIAGGLAFLFAIERSVPWHYLAIAILALNAGAMLGPSLQDLKNMWLALILLYFISWPAVEQLGIAALSYIALNIALQIVLILIIKIAQRYRNA